MNNPDESLLFMLGEIRSDLKYLVAEKSATNRRLDKLEASSASARSSIDERLKKLEGWKVRVGVLTGLLGVFVPTAITITAKRLGLL